MLVIWAIGAAITYLMLSVTWFMEAVGFCAVFTEAMLGEYLQNHNKCAFIEILRKLKLIYLGAPQFLRNFKNKSTYGMSIQMVIMWTLGDMFKTGYFIVRESPTQFWICGTLQVSEQILLINCVCP